MSKESDSDADALPFDGRILAQGLASKIKALADDEGPPLTTKVIVHAVTVPSNRSMAVGYARLGCRSAGSCIFPYSY